MIWDFSRSNSGFSLSPNPNYLLNKQVSSISEESFFRWLFFPIWHECSTRKNYFCLSQFEVCYKSKPCPIFGKCLSSHFNKVTYRGGRGLDFANSDKSSLQTELKKKTYLFFICCDNASLYGQKLCYSFSAVAIGKLLNVNIIYIAIACSVVLLFECCVCWVLWHICQVCVYVHFSKSISRQNISILNV